MMSHIWLVLLLQAVNVHSFSSPTTKCCLSHRTSPTVLSAKRYDLEVNRRLILQSALVTPFAIGTKPAFASDKPPPIIPLVTTAKRLHTVPLFTIVDGNGVPFHTYDKDSAGGFGYFFTTYQSALYVLDDAKNAFAKAKAEAAKNKETNAEDGAIGKDGTSDVPDAWGQAQIVTLPLDVVMQLSVKKTQSIAQNGKGNKFDTYYQVIPSAEDLNAALRIENSPRYNERGRVPLFFVDDLTIPSEEGVDVNPVFFRIKDLVSEWERQYPNKDIPKIKVRELNETFRAMIRPGGKDTSVEKLVFVPIPESVEKAKSCGRSYKLGEMILTK